MVADVQHAGHASRHGGPRGRRLGGSGGRKRRGDNRRGGRGPHAHTAGEGRRVAVTATASTTPTLSAIRPAKPHVENLLVEAKEIELCVACSAMHGIMEPVRQ